jgi:LysM repeat protein
MGCATIIETFVGVEEMHMASIKRGALVASTLMLITIVISACNQPYSQQPTATPGGPSLFETPITPGMGNIEVIGTTTALALSGTPVVGVPTQTLSSPADATSQSLFITATPMVSVGTATATLAVSGSSPTSGPLPTSAPVGSRPAEYQLRSGEFPYCIARRFDVDPDELLRLNGLSSGTIFYADRMLRIPQSGSFPGTRALRNHPATYTVASASETVNSIACLFGDVDPGAIVSANNLTSGTLTVGQQLSIP